ncbi:hypothetical protein [Candidatus Hodarchaeum mangrovi]
MVRSMKKTCWMFGLSLIILLIIFNSGIQVGNAYPIPPIVIVENHTRTPIVPDQGETTEVSCYVYHSGGSGLSVKLYYRINSGSFIEVTMTNTGSSYVKWETYRFYEYVNLLPARNRYDLVEYYILARAVADTEISEDRSPLTGYHSYIVDEPSEIAWISPDSGSEITFGPINDYFTFSFDWSYVNLDDAKLEIGSQTFDILDTSAKFQVTLNGAPLAGSTIAATLKGYKGSNLVASDSRSFSFRRLDYSLAWNSPSEGNTIAFSPSGLAKFNFTFSQGYDIDHVNLYFNDTDMGEVISPGTVLFTFQDFQGFIYATLKGFNSNDVELVQKTRTFVFRRLIVEVIWESPDENDTITFNPGNESETFNFTYSKGTDVAYVTLELNGLDMGVVTSPGSVTFQYNDSFHGIVEGKLKGYNSIDIEISSAIRHFRFEKEVAVRFEVLKENEIDLGKKLYLILHDPNGDGSFSSYEESSLFSIGIGCEITSSLTTGIEIGIEQESNFFGLFKTGGSASTKLSLSTEASLGFDARFEIIDSTFLSSSDSSSAVDFIGPGYGDRYWGELWRFKYVLTIHYIEYYNGTEVYYDPHLWWGILRDAEAYLSDYTAPDGWKQLNPVHQDYPEDQVEWIGGILISDGGGTYTNTHEVTSTKTITSSISIGIESETQAKLIAGGAYVEGTVDLSLNTKIYAEMNAGNTIKTSYTVRDDETTDSIVQRVGIDKNFGTYIFKTEKDFCSTSKPIEHNTIDYIPPQFGYPTIIYDTDQDFKGPTPMDNPLVTVKIEEEGGISDAFIYYSIDNGTSWRSTSLTEYSGLPEVWHANIPKQVNNTVVLWYLKAWDERGNVGEKYDITGSYFSYKVGILVNPFESPTPGFDLGIVLLGLALGGFLLLKRRRLSTK